MILSNTSFIVIARNESLVVGKCLDSIASMPLEDCEVICVDSASTDNTLDVMRSYQDRIPNLKIVRCSGHVNAAIARNAGIKYATKKYIYFVDGDIELVPEFLQDSLQRLEADEIDAATGTLDDIIYSEGYEQIVKPQYHRKYFPEVRNISGSGGSFIVRRQLLQTVGLWDIRMTRSQDYDYTIRVARQGRMVALPTTMGIHHTLAYRERPWLFFRKGYPMIFGMLIRKNWDRLDLLKGIVRDYRVGFVWWGLLIISTLAALLLGLSTWPVLACFGLMALLAVLWGICIGKHIVTLIFTHYFNIPLIVLGVFVNLRRTDKPTEIERIV